MVFSGTPAMTPIDHYHDIAILLNGVLNIHSLNHSPYSYDSMDPFHIHDLILKLCFLYECFPYDGQNGTRSGESNGKDKFESNFLS